jgi:beta-glucosidase
MDKFARFRYQPCLPLGEDGKRVTASKKHIDLSRQAAGEGMVLLKNSNNALPLAKGENIALFGKATIEYIKGGGGSGDVHCPYIRNIHEGFAEKENATDHADFSDFTHMAAFICMPGQRDKHHRIGNRFLHKEQ